jgi:hypothetical protein
MGAVDRLDIEIGEAGAVVLDESGPSGFQYGLAKDEAESLM